MEENLISENQNRKETFKISCIVAIYNVEKYLDRCIQSLINQKYGNVEIILVNDGSKDHSGEICQKYAKLDERVKVITQINQGANIARNQGILAATGEWVYFADGDDYVKENVFTELIDFLDLEYQMILFSNERWERGKNIIPKYPFQRIEFSEEDAYKELIIATLDRFSTSLYNYKVLDAVSIWNKLYKRNFLIDNNLFFVPKFPKLQDLTFNLMVYQECKKALFINHVGYVYQINEASISKRFQPDYINKMIVMLGWFDCYMSELDYDERIFTAYCGRLLTIFRTSIVIYFCNKNNPKKYKERKKEFEEFYEQYFKRDIKKYTNLMQLPFQERMLSITILNKWFWGSELLTVIKRVIKY